VACDQYTQDSAYWEHAGLERAGKPSTLSLILPEARLAEKDALVPIIRESMRGYVRGGVFAPAFTGMVYLERTTAFGRLRKGLVTAVDLEAYDWNPEKKARIRATESTIIERIPPRMDIRRDAPLETPHIMLLANDPDHALTETAGNAARKSGKKPLYDTDLMLGAGHITGYALNEPGELAAAENGLRYIAGQHPEDFFFAVGDGNHSLATAKAVWDEYKRDHPGITDHPARYALVEIVNIYDEGLTFEPIHRVLFDAEGEDLILYLAMRLESPVLSCPLEEFERVCASEPGAFGIVYTREGITRYTVLYTHTNELAVSVLQPLFDSFIAEHSGTSTDYIHGKNDLYALAHNESAVCVLMPPVAKETFFSTITAKGVLPRKSFSMGEASEKRFYFECRNLF
jgi:uncharacterized protein (DUF1015 family)